jgi:Domain of unknown function (DUF4157)
MSYRSTTTNQKPSSSFTPIQTEFLQRKGTACGQRSIDSGESNCTQQKNSLQRKLTIGASNDPLEQEADRIADQVLAAPANTTISSSPSRIQRFTGQTTNQAEVAPASVDRVLSSSGSPLEPELQQDMNQRFGHDFSRVRVHTGGEADRSAQDINANAYTLGHNIVFGAGQFAPRTSEGKRLIAHELTHVVQQSEVRNHDTGLRIPNTETQIEGHAKAGKIQKENNKALDEKAKKIIDAAKDAGKSIDQRAIDAVNNIIKTYYDPTLVEKITYDEKEPGLATSPVGTGKDIKGSITVGKYFIENIDSFARRVLQVGHELEHVQQQRAGMGGDTKRNEREFLAFHWEATNPEKAGTGKISHSTRVALIDEALRNYYCMPEENQKTHVDKKEELLKLRDVEEKASGNTHTDPPNKCGKVASQSTPSSNESQKKPGEKTTVTQPPPQKAEEKNGIDKAVKLGIETETKSNNGKTTTEVAGKLSFELTIPLTNKLQLGPVSFLKEVGLEGSTSLKFSESKPRFSPGVEATLKVISIDFEKVKIPLGIADFGISGSLLTGAEYSSEKFSVKSGVASEAEGKFKRSSNSPFFITIKGGVEKTYNKDGSADFQWSPLTWKVSSSVGFEF